MRIVGGILGGRKIPVPGRGVRPTSERVREALMSLLGPDWTGRRVLDCFAGSGAFGFEALSRGAASVTFLEQDRRTADGLLQTAAALSVADRVTLHRGDALSRLQRLSGTFDVLFFDPPYHHDLLEEALSAAQHLGTAGARFVAEHAAGHRPADPIGELCQSDHRQYGSTHISIYERQREAL